ncbi:MAG TPA: hypothetical protein PLP42_19555 [Acidobacteriota bacterium]|nr:hypothetical protein [Acidobacteriota bacterium]
MLYTVEVGGRVFQGTDIRALVRLAVQARQNINRATGDERERAGQATPGSSCADAGPYPQPIVPFRLISLHKTYAKC